jgi:hypothetical protein
MVSKTRAMIQVELQDALHRGKPQRDIRDLLDEALQAAGDLEGAGTLLGIDASTVCRWIATLRGKWDSRTKTLTFENYALKSASSEETGAALAGVAS